MLIQTTQICDECKKPVLYDSEQTVYLWHDHFGEFLKALLVGKEIVK